MVTSDAVVRVLPGQSLLDQEGEAVIDGGSGEQRGDGGAAVEAEGPAEHVADLLRGVDADLAVDGRGEVGGGVTGGGGVGADLVGGAQDEAGAGAAAGDQRGEDAAPVVAPGAGGVGDGGLLADARGAAELAGDDQEDVVGQAAGVEVFDQGGDAAVEGGSRVFLRVVKLSLCVSQWFMTPRLTWTRPTPASTRRRARRRPWPMRWRP